MLRRYLSWPLTVRVAILVWFAMLLSVTLRVAIAPPCKGTVVNIYILAAERWLAGENVYLWEPGIDLYRNPPGVTPLLTPLTLVPAKTAGVLWRLGSAAVFLVGLRSFLRSMLVFTPSQQGAIFAFTLPLALASLSNGQLNLLLSGLLMLGTSAAARRHDRSGSLWLAAAGGLKVYPVSVGLLLAVASPRRVLPGLLLGLTAFAALPFLCQRTGYVLEMHRSLMFSMTHDLRSYDDVNRAPQDAFLVPHACGADPGKAAYHAVQLASALGMALLVLRTRQRGGTPAELAALSFHLGCIWMTVFGPATEGPTYTLLAPSAAILLVASHARRAEPGGKTRFRLTLTGYALLVSPILRDAFPHGAAYRCLGPFPAGGLFLLAAVMVEALQRPLLKVPPLITTQRIRFVCEDIERRLADRVSAVPQ